MATGNCYAVQTTDIELNFLTYGKKTVYQKGIPIVINSDSCNLSFEICEDVFILY